MNTKNVLQTAIKKAKPAVISLSLLLVTGATFVPAIASANNGLHLGTLFNTQAKQKRAEASANVELKMFNDDVKTAKQTFHAAVKQAKTNYRAAIKTAHDKYKASLSAATTMQARVDALKIYMTEKLTAYKAKNVAVEAAFQTFINTNFNVN